MFTLVDLAAEDIADSFEVDMEFAGAGSSDRDLAADSTAVVVTDTVVDIVEDMKDKLELFAVD